ncbi:DUF452 family protein [Phocaeicola sp.]
MKHYFIHKQNHPRLTLFFAGWGMDEHPFMDYCPEDGDLLICYDYRSLHFEYSLLEGYEEIRVVGWSMGVWAAAQVLQHTEFPITESIAVNGTMTPKDNEKGIPEMIFEGTLKGLNATGLQKFRRRMCGSGEAMNVFLENEPQRSLEELRDELRLIGEQVSALPFFKFEWKKAVIGKRDLIFAAANQWNAWRDTGAEIIEQDIPHYSEELLRNIVCRSNFVPS